MATISRLSSNQEGGFTLIEIVITAALFAGAFIAVFSLFATVSQSNRRARDLTHATQLAGRMMDHYRNYPGGFDEIPANEPEQVQGCSEPLIDASAPANDVLQDSPLLLPEAIVEITQCYTEAGRIKRVDVTITYNEPPGTRRRTISTSTEIADTGISYSVGVFPTVVGTATGDENDHTTSHPINLPGSIESGDLLVVIFRASSAGDPAPDINLPADWTPLATRNSGGDTVVFTKIAAGNDSATITTNGARYSVHISYRIRGSYSGNPLGEIIRAEIAGSNTLDPPSLSAPWGSGQHLWLAATTMRRTGQSGALSAAPSSYFGFVLSKACSVCGGDQITAQAGSARRNLVAASENPSSFTADGTQNAPHALTIVVRRPLFGP